MGRPIKSIYFGSPKGTGVGGEGVIYANVWVAGTGYYSANAAVTFSAPQITGGTTATGTVSLNGSGNVTAILVTSAGSGYTSTPTATITGANASPASANVTLFGGTVTADAIFANAWVAGASIGKTADIVTQRSSRRYRVTNADGTSVCRLVPTGLNGVNSPTVAAVISAGGPTAEGQMTIIATDSAGGKYLVGKLESRTALVFPAAIGGSAGTEFAANTHVRWNVDSAVLNTSVVIDNR
jgi:hypothetical protein